MYVCFYVFDTLYLMMPMASANQQVRSVGPGVTEGDVPVTEKEEREVASEVDLKISLCQAFFCQTYNLRQGDGDTTPADSAVGDQG